MYQQKVTFENELGLNARLAGTLVKEINSHESHITMEYDGKTVNAKSLMSMLSLHPVKGAEVLFTAEGPDEVQAVESACALIKDYAENEKRENAEREARKAKRKEMLLRFLPFLRNWTVESF